MKTKAVIAFFLVVFFASGLPVISPFAEAAGEPELVKDINPFGPSFPNDLTNINGTLYFSADDGSNGRELWKSNGAERGTVRVKDIRPGGGDSSPSNLTIVDDWLFFRASDGISGTELWKSDGTAAGTVLVKDIYSGTTGSDPYDLTIVNGTLFFRANDGISGAEYNNFKIEQL